MPEADTTTATTPAAPWYEGKLDENLVAHATAKGWDLKDPADLAVKAAHAHWAAEKMIGTPTEALLKLPKDGNDLQGWDTVWTRLGAAKTAQEYDLGDAKFTDGTAIEPEVGDLLKTLAAKYHLPKTAAPAFAKDYLQYLERMNAAAVAEQAAALETERTGLRSSWGTNFDSNMVIARNAVAALGVPPEAVSALEGQVGYAKVMEMFRAIGTKIGEDKFVGGNTTRAGVMSKEDAAVRLTELKADSLWVDRFLKGDIAAKRESENLHMILAA